MKNNSKDPSEINLKLEKTQKALKLAIRFIDEQFKIMQLSCPKKSNGCGNCTTGCKPKNLLLEIEQILLREKVHYNKWD